MGLMQRFLSSVGLGATEGRDATSDHWWGEAVIQSFAGETVTATTGLQYWAVQACLEALASPPSTLPLMVFERTGENTRRPAPEHPVFKLLHSRPNARQTAQEFRDEQQRHLGWWRNAYAIIHPAADGGPVGSLEQVHPSRVIDVWRGGDGWVYYRFARLAPASGWDTYREDKIWHVRRAPLTNDGLRGRPVFETARETIGRGMAVEKFGALFFRNGGFGGGMLEHPGSFKDKEEQQKFLEAWRAGGTGLNQHKDRLLLNGVKYNRNPIRNDESQFLETKKQCGYETASIWNMPPHRVGMLERATNNNIEQQSIEFVVYTLAAPIAATEQSAEQNLLIGDEQDRYFIEHNVAGLLRGDIKTRYAAYAIGRQWGWLSVNKILELENQNPIGPEGDVHLTPTNMVPAGSVPPPKFTPDDDKPEEKA